MRAHSNVSLLVLTRQCLFDLAENSDLISSAIEDVTHELIEMEVP